MHTDGMEAEEKLDNYKIYCPAFYLIFPACQINFGGSHGDVI